MLRKCKDCKRKALQKAPLPTLRESAPSRPPVSLQLPTVPSSRVFATSYPSCSRFRRVHDSRTANAVERQELRAPDPGPHGPARRLEAHPLAGSSPVWADSPIYRGHSPISKFRFVRPKSSNLKHLPQSSLISLIYIGVGSLLAFSPVFSPHGPKGLQTRVNE